MTHTAEEVRHCARYINRAGSIGYEGMYAKASDMLTAYADLLERREAGVTEDVCREVLRRLPLGIVGVSMKTVRDALLAVWPASAEPPEGHSVRVLSHDGEYETEARWEHQENAYVTTNAIRVAAEPAQDKCFCDRMYPKSNPDASCGDCPTRDYKSAEPAQPADSGRVTNEMIDAAMTAHRDAGAYGLSRYLCIRAAISAALAAQGQPAEPVAQAGDLQPCPFCGGRCEMVKGSATEAVWPQGTFHRVFCTSCQARQLFHKTPGDAAAAWNRRAQPRAVPAERVPDVAAMVNRFLGWRLPDDFAPDCGISFDGRKGDQWNKNKTWPIGTNLFTAAQAEAMVEYMLPAAPQPGEPDTEDSRND